MNGINKTKIGFNYFQDFEHYQDSDAQQWIPILKDLNAAWLVLNVPTNKTISDSFIKAMRNAGIELILHFKFSLKDLPDIDQFRSIVKNYATWGIRYIALFDRPNLRSQWDKIEWQQPNLPQRFADLFANLAQPVIDAGLTPILAPMQPGGDFWDTAFLDNVLTELKNDHGLQWLKNIGIGAYAWFNDHPVAWGAGGQDIFPATKPYFTPTGSQDNKGFHIYDWYNTVLFSHVDTGLPIFLLGVGEETGLISAERHQETLADVLETLKLDQTDMLTRIPENVLSCNFWLLSALESDPAYSQAWFNPAGQPLRSPELLQTIYVQEQDLANNTVLEDGYENEGFHIETEPSLSQSESVAETTEQKRIHGYDPHFDASNFVHKDKAENKVEVGIGKPVTIENYVLLPAYDWGVSDWHLDVIKPYVKKYKPTIGFSVKEARAAKNVLVIGVASDFPNQNLSELYAAGCNVTQMRGDAEKIAEALAKA